MKRILKQPRAVKAAISTQQFERVAIRVTLISVVGNAVLSLLKALVGIFAHSGAMVSDAIHSASDLLSSIIVIVGIKLSSRKSDKTHPYGHERFECVAAIVLSIILLFSGLLIGQSAIREIFSGNIQELAAPGVLAIVAAIISIISKEAMYWYTRHHARHLNSGALMADAWHHRSDALSSVGALIGIIGARCGYAVLERIASLVICLFIAKAAYDIFKDAVSKMVDRSCSEQTESAIRGCALAQEGVLGIDLMNTRLFGNRIYVDIEISASADITLEEGHSIAHNVHNAIEENFEQVKHIMVHVNPATPPPK